MVKTTIRDYSPQKQHFTVNYLLSVHAGKAFVGRESNNPRKAIFWVTYAAIVVFPENNDDYIAGGSWSVGSNSEFNVDRFIDIEVKEV